MWMPINQVLTSTSEHIRGLYHQINGQLSEKQMMKRGGKQKESPVDDMNTEDQMNILA